MSLSTAIILSLVVTVFVSGEPSLLSQNPTLILAEDSLPKPYQFGYDFADGLGMSRHRQKIADSSGAVKGSYGYIDPLGVQRTVEYTADKDGYRAVIKSNEPGTSGQGSANALFIVQPPPLVAVDQGLKPLIVNSL